MALTIFPQMGTVYDPPYAAAVPRYAMRVTYAGGYGIYYTVDEEARTVNVEYVENQRVDPGRRFDTDTPYE